MDQCARCGHALGVGRFCVNCGHSRDTGPPEDPRTATAERPAVRDDGPWGPPPASPPTAAPPSAYGTPPKVRYPLYADEPPRGPSESTELAATPPAWATPTEGAPSHRRRRALLPILLVVAALVLVAAAGAYLLVGPGDDADEASDPPPEAPNTGQSSSPTPTPTPSPTPEPSPTSEPTPREPRDVARTAVATAPRTAGPSRDVDGNAVRYDALNMLDGEPDTAWRMPGDGTGSVIAFELDRPTTLTEVGLLNGYAKRDPGYDGYAANRRIIAVEWVFADGTVVEQTLGEDRAPQSIEVDTVTDRVELRIVAVTAPGRGPSGRDFTAISDVALVGVPLP